MAIRIVHNAPYNAHTEPLFKNAGVLPLSYLIEFFILQFVQQFTQGFLPISFNNTWVSNAIRRQDEFQVSLRNDDDINIPFARTAQTERFPLTKFPKVWHNFPNENIKFQRNKLIFNEELKIIFCHCLKQTIDVRGFYVLIAIPLTDCEFLNLYVSIIIFSS